MTSPLAWARWAIRVVARLRNTERHRRVLPRRVALIAIGWRGWPGRCRPGARRWWARRAVWCGIRHRIGGRARVGRAVGCWRHRWDTSPPLAALLDPQLKVRAAIRHEPALDG